MAGPGERLLLMAENFFTTDQFPNHVVVGQEEAAGFPAVNVGDGRRHPADRWQPTTANADRWIKVTCDELRAADCFVIDRASNHLGERFILEASSDDFATAQTIFDVTIPTVPGGQPGDPLGCVTDEGAWVKTFTAAAAYGWRLTSKAMGASIVPQIAGLWLGKAWQPVNVLLNWPLPDEAIRYAAAASASTYGWRGKATPTRPRFGQLVIEPGDENDYDAIRYQIVGLMARAYAAWIFPSRQLGATRGILAGLPDAADLDFAATQYPYRKMTVNYLEEQALP